MASGEAISFAFSSVADIYFDTIIRCLNDIESVHNCDFVFVCVFTQCMRMVHRFIIC